MKHGAASGLSIFDIKHVEVLREVQETEFSENQNSQENHARCQNQLNSVLNDSSHDVLKDIKVILNRSDFRKDKGDLRWNRTIEAQRRKPLALSQPRWWLICWRKCIWSRSLWSRSRWCSQSILFQELNTYCPRSGESASINLFYRQCRLLLYSYSWTSDQGFLLHIPPSFAKFFGSKKGTCLWDSFW